MRWMLLTMSRRVGCVEAGPRSGIERRSIDVLDLLLGVLDREVVRIPVARIDPQAGRDHLVRCQGRDDVCDDFSLAQAEFAGAHSVDVKLQARADRDPAG